MGTAEACRRLPWLTWRWTSVALGVLLALLSGYTVTGNWRQAAIVREVESNARDLDAYREASYLALSELELIQASLREPDGEERHDLLTVHAQAQAAIDRLVATHNKPHEEFEALAEKQRRLRPLLGTYLQLLDRGDEEAAERTLENSIEPLSGVVRDTLLRAESSQRVEYAQRQADARHESEVLRGGSVLTFALGLVVLTLFGLSSRRHRRQVEALATTDALTGLPNRSAFTGGLEQVLDDARSTTVLTINLDGFRDVNDQLGHEIGDRLLTEVGRRLTDAVRGDDLVARLGGDEFAVLLTAAATDDVEAIADRLSTACKEPYLLGEVTVDLEVSMGAADVAPGESAATVLAHADLAMHTAKEHRLGFRQFAPTENPDPAARLSLLGDLRRALDDETQLRLHYQPKVAVADGSVVGVEALARWEHPTKGSISPGQFIPVLEATTLMHLFTDHVLAMALTQTRAWLDAGHRIPTAVNVSTRTLLDPSFPERVAALLRQAGVPGELLCIEVTECTVMSDPATTINALHRLRRLGAKTSVDDFGTGYSSMAYLKTLPLDELKVDRTFVSDMAVDRGNHALVVSTVDLAHNLGLVVVAEGVEDRQTHQALAAIGCDVAQGYHFARPMNAADLTHHLTAKLPASAPG